MHTIPHTASGMSNESAPNSPHVELAKHHAKRKGFGRFLNILGPGLVSGAADDDPSGIATYSQAGAMYGFSFLWAFPLMYPLLLAVQESCSRIGAVTGKGLAAVLKENYSKWVLYLAVALVFVANTINIGSDLGAMAAAMQLIIPVPFFVLVILFAVIIVLLEVLIPYTMYAKILKWLAITLFAYPITAFLVGQDWKIIFYETFSFRPTINFETAYILVGIFGTTVSPYLFFWDTSEVVEEEIAQHRLNKSGGSPRISHRFLNDLQIDNFVGMTLASVTAWFIVIVCGSVLFSHGITEINSAADAALALEPLVSHFPNAGLIAKLIFSIGILGLGLLAIPTLAGSASYAISETMGWREGLYRNVTKAPGFYAVIIVATFVGLLTNFIGVDPIKALVFTAVFNGIAAIPLLLMIARVGNNQKIMGEYKNGMVSNIFVRLAFVCMTVAVLFLFYTVLAGKA
ncbi:divalent metal cation transporter [candidate division WWE3 bacterium]|nr:divalent metal cation transporter [candidate division WWE3 bacterium]